MRVMQFVKMHKVISAVVLVDVILVLATVAAGVAKASKNSTLDVLVVPEIAKVSIGSGDYGIGAYKIRPGNYAATVSAKGFKSKVVEVKPEGGSIAKLHVYLEPEDDNLNYYATHLENYNNLRWIDDEEAQKMYKILSIRYALPMMDEVRDETTGYLERRVSIEAENGDGCKAYFCLKAILLGTNDKKWAEELIKKKGFNPENYEIRYKVY